MQDLSTKLTGDSLTATEWNQVPKEIQNVITALGISLTSTDLNQLGKAIAGYVANGNFYTDSGVADAYVLTQIGSKQAPTAYTDGFLAIFRPGNGNTGACTVNIATLGVKSIKTSLGADPASSSLVAGNLYMLSYDNTNGWFELVEFGGGGQMLGTEAVKGIFYNSTVINENVVVPANTNAGSFGPIEVGTGYTIDVTATGATWSIVGG